MVIFQKHLHKMNNNMKIIIYAYFCLSNGPFLKSCLHQNLHTIDGCRRDVLAEFVTDDLIPNI